MSVPRVAIVGRQNVGKSTLANRLFGRRHAIAHDTPGVTRDRIELETTWRGRRMALVDTAGLLGRPRGVEALAARQSERAIEQAAAVVLMVDVRAGITEEDAAIARRLRRHPAPVLVAVNKVDSPKDEVDVDAFYALGLGEPIAISALHGGGTGELLDAIVGVLPDEDEPSSEDRVEPTFAVVGRPNVGKSTLFNRLVGEDRSVVSDVGGTTRDSVDSLVTWPDGTRVRFVDTAGMRRRRMAKSIEYYSYLRAAEAIDRSHVAVLVVDATAGFTSEDKRIAAHVMDAGRAFLVVANKWDLLQDRDRSYKELSEVVRPFARASALRVSAKTGQGVGRIAPSLLDLHGRWSSRAATSEVNGLIQQAQREKPTPRRTGNLHYATQVSTGPPTFVLFGGANPPDKSYRRFLENRLRRELGLDGVPLRLRFRARRSRSAGRG